MTASELALAASKVINVLGIIILSSSSAADKKMESEISKVSHRQYANSYF
jgi:hypothetical protein